MVKQEDENSNSSSEDSSSSFSSVSKSRKQVSKSIMKQGSKNNLINSKATASSGHNSLNSSTLSGLGGNSSQAITYSNQANSSFKISSSNFNSQAIKNVANQLAAGNSINSVAGLPNSSTSISSLNQQTYFQNSLPAITSDLYKMPAAGALHLLNSANNTQNRESGSSNKNHVDIASQLENNRQRERIGMSSNCSSSSNSSNASFNNGSNSNTGEVIVVEETVRKREMRLLKNREAARECRRKKKEYIKCLENRVAVLENQNKTLIDELKSLKELYCQNGDPTHK